jgi:hypothetical protein
MGKNGEKLRMGRKVTPPPKQIINYNGGQVFLSGTRRRKKSITKPSIWYLYTTDYIGERYDKEINSFKEVFHLKNLFIPMGIKKIKFHKYRDHHYILTPAKNDHRWVTEVKLIDIKTGIVSTLDTKMNVERESPKIAVFENGDILIHGGFGATKQRDSFSNRLSTGEYYNSKTKQFELVKSRYTRRGFQMTQLQDDSVLITGGDYNGGFRPGGFVREAELFVPKK